jgi:hypothetical protein
VSLGPEADDKPLVRRDGLIAIVQPSRQPCLLMSVLKTRNHEKTIYKSFATRMQSFFSKESHLTRVWDKERRNGSWQFHDDPSTDAVPLTQRETPPNTSAKPLISGA